MKNYKGVLYGAIAYSVIIGAIFVALSVLGLLSRWCVIETNGSAIVYMMYLIYFRVESCEANIQWDILNVNNGLPVVMPEETEAVQRTFILFLVYLGLHSALIITSLYALCGVKNSCMGSKSFPIFFAPWIIVLVAVIVLDILSTVYFIIDITQANADGIMNLLEVANPDAARSNFESIAFSVKFLPSLFMLLASSKVFVLIIVNIVWVVVISKAGWTASTYHKYLDQTRRNYENTMAIQSVNQAFEDIHDDAVAQKQHERQMGYANDNPSIHEVQPSAATATTNPSAPPAETRYDDTTRVQAFVYTHHQITKNERQQQQPSRFVEEEEENPHHYKIQRPNTLMIPDRPSSRQQQNQQIRNEPERDIDSRLSRYQESNGSVIKSVEPLKYNEDIPEQQQSNIRIRVLPPMVVNNKHNEPKQAQMNRSHSELKPKPLPPPKPQNNRYSMQPSGNESPVLYRPERERVNNPKVDRTSSSIRAPDELRSQLPWSYFKPREDAPRRAFNNLNENEETPAVPVPDYTLHYGKKARGNLSDSDGDGSWNHQRY